MQAERIAGASADEQQRGNERPNKLRLDTLGHQYSS
jgi:hypothetical protein